VVGVVVIVLNGTLKLLQMLLLAKGDVTIKSSQLSNVLFLKMRGGMFSHHGSCGDKKRRL
jgi:hypothetical protein